MRLLQSVLLASLVTSVAMFATHRVAHACPFCSAASQTLRQEMTSMDVVGFASLVPSDQATIDGQADFKITEVVRGGDLAKEGNTLSAPYFGPGKTDKQFLVMAVKSDELLWSSPLTLSDTSRKYVEEVFKLPEDAVARLKFFYEYLDSKEPLLSGDAYDEFALAPYADVKAAKDCFKKDELWSWLNDDTVSPDRKRLYYTLLGIIGDKSDAPQLEDRLKSDDVNKRAGLDALIACYLTLVGDDGLPLVDELFLKNTKSAYSDTYAAIQALRFQGTDGGAIGREGLLRSFRLMLERPDYADLVIPDLARWEDWSQVDKVTELFIKADASTNWVRVPVINYLRTCPLPAAKEKLKELEAIDPKSFQRANTFFPLPPPSQPSPTDSSVNRHDYSDKIQVASDVEESQSVMRSDTPSLLAFVQARSVNRSEVVNGIDASTSPIDAVKLGEVNHLKAIAVTLLASINLSLVLGLVMTGGSTQLSIAPRLIAWLNRQIS